MKALILLSALLVAVAGCDSGSDLNEFDSDQLVDDGTVGAKPTKASIDQVASSGWSGQLAMTRQKDGRLKWRVVATGLPNKLVTFCIVEPPATTPCFLGPSTNDRGKLSTGWRVGPYFLPQGSTRSWDLKVNNVVVASTGGITLP